MNDTVLYEVNGEIAVKANLSDRERLGFVDAMMRGRAPCAIGRHRERPRGRAGLPREA